MEETKLDALKKIADNMMIKYSPNIGEEALQKKIDEKREEKPAKKLSKTERYREIAKEQMKLVRCRVTCFDPQKKAWQGETLSVSNKAIGSFQKFVQYDVEYHLPQIMVDRLKECVYRKTVTRKGKDGQLIKNTTMPKSYAIEILPQLTMKELEQLAADQRKRGAIGND